MAGRLAAEAEIEVDLLTLTLTLTLALADIEAEAKVEVGRLGGVVEQKAVHARAVEVRGPVAAQEHERFVERLGRGLAVPHLVSVRVTVRVRVRVRVRA